jgi:hypothetical protein
VLLILPNAKIRKVSFSLNFKLYDFDEVFWNLVDLREIMDWGPEELGAYKMEDGTVVVIDSVFRGPDFWGTVAGGMT